MHVDDFLQMRILRGGAERHFPARCPVISTSREEMLCSHKMCDVSSPPTGERFEATSYIPGRGCGGSSCSSLYNPIRMSADMCKTEKGDGGRSASTASVASSTMEIDSYAAHSKNQYAAHLLTRDMLSSSMERLARRCNLEDMSSTSNGTPMRRRRMVDLGPADGSCSMETLKFAIDCLNNSNESGSGGDNILPIHITFEEHPASSKEKLESTLHAHDEWFNQNDIKWDVLMKSFYEPLFEAQTIDFMMSYICLHWLDNSGVDNISEWKTLGMDDDNDPSHLEWTSVNEATAPTHIREAWRTNLAHAHLAKFLSLRATELRPGAEMILVMVGHPHEFLSPSDGGPGPLTRAMKRCIQRGELREDVLRRTVIPYFLRTVCDVEAAFEKTLAMGDSSAMGGPLLELIECRSVPTVTKGDDDDDPLAFDLFWSIHSHAVENANPTEKELQCIKAETRRVFNEIYDRDVGVPSSFVACTMRRLKC